MNFLLPTDGSDNSASAVSFLNRLPLQKEDRIDLVHVVTEPGHLGETYELYDQLFRLKEEMGDRVLEEAETRLESSAATVERVLLRGYPYHEILESSRNRGADIIVMGSRGLAGFESFLLGSVTRKVAINAPVPVLVIKPPQGQNGDAPLNILFATDGSPCAKKAAAALHAFPFPSSSRLTILHVVDSPLGDIPERFGIEVDERIKSTVADVRGLEMQKAEALLEVEKGVFANRFESIDTVVRSGDVAPTIIEKVKKIGADIVVIGCRGERGIKSMLGGVSRRILSYAPCSVLVSKMPGE